MSMAVSEARNSQLTECDVAEICRVTVMVAMSGVITDVGIALHDVGTWPAAAGDVAGDAAVDAAVGVAAPALVAVPPDVLLEELQPATSTAARAPSRMRR
jgi:hypothetical protein